MSPFTVLIPARLGSSRLPNKPLADLAGLPMVVRVAQQAAQSQAQQVVVAADDPLIVSACEAHGVRALLTRVDHPSGSDRLAEACDLLGLSDDDLVDQWDVGSNIKEIVDSWKTSGKIGTSTPKTKQQALKQAIAISVSKAKGKK